MPGLMREEPTHKIIKSSLDITGSPEKKIKRKKTIDATDMDDRVNLASESTSINERKTKRIRSAIDGVVIGPNGPLTENEQMLMKTYRISRRPGNK